MQSWMEIAFEIILLICVCGIFLINRQKPCKEQQIMQVIVAFMGITMLGYYFRITADTMEAA